MSVCVAALSEDQKAIVCIADKALSYGDAIQWDSDTSKIIRLGKNGPLVLFAGDEDATTRVLAGLLARANDFGNDKSRAEILRGCEKEYKAAMEELVEAQFLTPRLLRMEDYRAAITAPPVINPYMTALADEIKSYEMKCQLLVCGFASDGLPYILTLVNPGIATDMTQTGFHAIGSGWEKAIAKLLFSEYKRSYRLHRTMYDAFDAKAFAEMAVGVGYAWDSQIVTKDRIWEIPKEVRELIEKGWAKATRSPFEKYNAKEDVPPPPKDWIKTLDSYFRLLIENPDALSAMSAKLGPMVSLVVKGDAATEPKLMSSEDLRRVRKMMKFGEEMNEKIEQAKSTAPSTSQTSEPEP